MPTVTASATTANVCSCCGTLSGATLQCRIRGGTATVCGYSEYGTPSVPPKKYTIRTLGGAITYCYHLNPGCVDIDTASPGFQSSYSGTCQYQNCIENNVSALQTVISLNTSCSPTTPAGNAATCVINASSVTSENTSTTVKTYTGIGCFFEASRYILASGSATETLSDEDTNQDAIDRLLAGAGGVWGSWLSPGGAGCTGIPPACCLARWEERETDFDFVYQEAEYRVSATGLTPSTTYNARVEIYRSEFGASSFSLFQTLIISGTTDGSGNFSEDGAVPNEEGFESYAAAAYIVIPS